MGVTPMSSNAWIVTIHYSEDGYVKDDDAAKINYDKLLKQMQEGIAEGNKYLNLFASHPPIAERIAALEARRA